jgi:hypothetical protein
MGGNEAKIPKKYQYYCKERDIRDEVFKMSQKEDASLEDFVERF